MESIQLGVQYPDGVIKKTWVHGCRRDGDDIKIEEVLQKDDITLAVLGAFQVDGDWVKGKLNEGTRVYWVLQAKTNFEVSVHDKSLAYNISRLYGYQTLQRTAPLASPSIRLRETLAGTGYVAFGL